MASEAEVLAAVEAYCSFTRTIPVTGGITHALEAAERVRAAEMAKLEKSLTSLIREDRPE